MKSKYSILLVFAAAVCFLLQSKAAPNLNSADNFAVLAGTTVTSVGGTIVNGDIGVYPGATVTGFGPGVVNGATYAGGEVAFQAENDTLSAYSILSSEAAIQNLTGQDLGGLTLTPGARNFDAAAQLTGTLILDAQGDINATFIFQIMSTLTTASESSIILINGAQAGNVFWQVGTSATLGLGSSFDGNILADQSITLDNGASLSGRALAINGAVSLNDNIVGIPIATPEPSSTGLLLAGGLAMGIWRRHKAGGS